jgi:hypothetical protein
MRELETEAMTDTEPYGGGVIPPVNTIPGFPPASINPKVQEIANEIALAVMAVLVRYGFGPTVPTPPPPPPPSGPMA